MDPTPWPPLHAYALAHRCTTCKAKPGEPCDAPRKNARSDCDPIGRMHATRQDVGRRHYRRDVGRAPWAEDREPGRRYDSLGDAWTPST